MIRINLIFSLGLLVYGVTLVASQRDSRRLSDPYRDFKSPCGTANAMASRTASCLDSIFELVEGKGAEPKSDVEYQGYCQRFVEAERCARTVSKDCLSGIHRTAVSAVASATKRWRTRECRSVESRARYGDPMRCAIKKGVEMSGVFNNHTGYMQAIRDLQVPPEEKLVKMCCILNSFDRELETRYNRDCPKSMPLIVGIVHAMTDDARSTLCVNPKCAGALDKLGSTRYRPRQNLIEPVLQILFQLSTRE